MRTLPQLMRGQHRFLDTYIHDTVRVIESLDISGGFVFEHWRWLTSYPPASRDGVMDEAEQLPATHPLLSPRIGALYRVDDQLAVRGDAYRMLRTPTLGELYEPVQSGDVVTAGNLALAPETVSTVEVGPQLTTRELDARAALYWSEIDAPITAVTLADGSRQRENLDRASASGVDTAASWRPAKAWRATIAYTFAATTVTRADAHPELVATELALAPKHRAVASLTFADPRLVMVTGAVRYVGRQFQDDRNTVTTDGYAVVDALAVRKITGGVAGWVSIDNLFDRRYVATRTGIDVLGPPRMIAIGVRIDSARF